MARYTGPHHQEVPSPRVDLVGGDKNFELRPFPPGQHGRRRIQEKEYLTQLQEKQKARFTYGVAEKQFIRYYREAASRPGKTGENLLTILESRLDNVTAARPGLHPAALPSASSATATSRSTASASTCPPTGSSSTTSSRSASSPWSPSRSSLARQTYGDRPVPAWMQVVPGTLQILIHRLPTRAQIDTVLTEQLIVEFYSRTSGASRLVLGSMKLVALRASRSWLHKN